MISITANNHTVLSALNRLAYSLTPSAMRPVMMEIGEELAASTTERFKTGMAPDGSRWPAISDATLLSRLRKGNSSTKPLVDTGALSDPTLNGPRYQIIDGGAGVVVGVNRNFGGANASVHQFGTSRAGRNRTVTIPARPFLGLSAQDERTVLDIIERFFDDQIG
ncbi:MAG: phage virion morphogenesis protein [Azoarcus sp.]|jgi:phage virion morphogenesis protein|nr:phage virion morphogenesis protein [Azoarcus sp.]